MRYVLMAIAGVALSAILGVTGFRTSKRSANDQKSEVQALLASAELTLPHQASAGSSWHVRCAMLSEPLLRWPSWLDLPSCWRPTGHGGRSWPIAERSSRWRR